MLCKATEHVSYSRLSKKEGTFDSPGRGVYYSPVSLSDTGQLGRWVHTISAQNAASKRAAYDKRAWQCLISARGSV